MRIRLRVGLLGVACAIVITPLQAAAQEFSGCTTWDRVSRGVVWIGPNRVRFVGNVEITCDDYRFFADEVEVSTLDDNASAKGNVLLVSPDARISAESMEFDLKTRTGVFHDATGTAFLPDVTERSMFGTQEPEAYFYGSTIEKIGPQLYRITRGAFTTCVQPTPRWEITSSSVTIKVNHHATLRNSLLRVKNVPVFYFPALYYPLDEDGRSTGVLIPTYGNSTYRGQSLSNAFFWAIGRSQDATFFHDWFTSRGQGLGGEYRYVAAPGSDGTARVYFLDEHESITGSGGTEMVQPARRSYSISSSVNQALGGRLRARANVDYFSDVSVQQTYQTDIYRATLRSRSYGGNVAGSWGNYSLNGTLSLSELFYSETRSQVYGSFPRISFAQSSRQLGRLPLYVSAGAGFDRKIYTSRSGTTTTERGLTSLDFSEAVRIPFPSLQFLPVSSTVTFRQTYYSQSVDATGHQVAVPLWRTYMEAGSTVVGPVFVRVWNTPSNGYAERVKHVIEPSVSVVYTSDIDNAASVVRLDASDYTIGGNTKIKYGLTNRILAKRRFGETSSAREILTIDVNQTYYTDEFASQYDYNYSTGFRGRPPSLFSPLSISVNGGPGDAINAGLRLEYDFDLPGFQNIALNASSKVGDRFQATGGISRRRLSNSLRLDNFLKAAVTATAPGNHFGGTFSFDYDLGRDTLLQKRLVAYYNAQCCGILVEYQTFNLPTFSAGFVIPQDRRFNVSFTLAGVGTFSNFFGAFGGTQGR